MPGNNRKCRKIKIILELEIRYIFPYKAGETKQIKK